MPLTKELQGRLSGEFQLIADKILGTKDPAKRLFYFSAFYGETQRALNWQWDDNLVLLHTVLSDTYQVAQARLGAIMRGDRAVSLPPDYFDLLAQVSADLADLVKDDDIETGLLEILRRLAKLGYMCTGNGGYLFEKGVIKP